MKKLFEQHPILLISKFLISNNFPFMVCPIHTAPYHLNIFLTTYSFFHKSAIDFYKENN